MRRDWLLPQIASVMLSLLAAGAFGEKFRVCIPYLRASTSDVEVLTALAAIDDVNGRQCGLLGGSCPETLQGPAHFCSSWHGELPG